MDLLWFSLYLAQNGFEHFSCHWRTRLSVKTYSNLSTMMQIISKTTKHWDLPTGELYPYRSSRFSVTGSSSDSISNFSKHWSDPCYAHLFQTELLITWTLQLRYLQDYLLHFKLSQKQSYWFDISLQLLFQAYFLIWPRTLRKIALGFRLLFLNFSILIQTACFRSWFWVTFQRYSPKQMAPSFCTNIQVCIWVLVMHGWSTMSHFI